LDDLQRNEAERHLARARTIPVELTSVEVETFYEVISNGVLWPLFHDRIDRLPMHLEGWDDYERVNARFADAVVAAWKPGDVVWIHDYHLLRLPALLRARLPAARIGFFLHVPFPNPEMFLTLPVRQWLVEGMLGADLIGFHTKRYRGHFTAVLRRLFGLEMDADANVRTAGRAIQLGVFPMGVDARDIGQRASLRGVTAKVLELKSQAGRLIVGIDRLDYSKGIVRRLAAVERFLADHPESHGRARMVQVAVPTRDDVGAYQTFKAEVEGMVGRINGRFGTAAWTPIQYLHRAVDDELLMALYRAADVMLVTPLRDGMNLVAKEFVAARADEDGVLVLSEFAGAADELTDALIVNPYDVAGVAAMIQRAFLLDGSERRRRMRRLREQVLTHDVHRWAAAFLSVLAGATPQP
jgi:trehalose 6-phosphate synthase/phosphatase